MWEGQGARCVSVGGSATAEVLWGVGRGKEGEDGGGLAGHGARGVQGGRLCQAEEVR